MRLVLSLALLFLTSVVAPTLALPNTPVICDVARIKKHQLGGTGATRLSAASTTVAAGGTTTISLQGGFTGFLLYVKNAAGTHVGTMTPTGANVGASSPCNNGVTAGSTVGHNSATTKTAMSWTWTAPITAGTYQAVAMVAESGAGLPPVFQPAPVLITVQAAQAPATQAPVPTQPPATQAPKPTTPPATNTNPTNPPTTKANPTNLPNKPNPTDPPATNPNPNSNPTNPAAAPTNPPPADTTTTGAAAAPTTIQQLLNTVLVRLQAALSGNGTVSQLKKLIKELQTAVQKAKTAKGSPTATQPVQVVVTKTTPVDTIPTTQVAAAAAAAAGSSLYSLQIGFGSQEDAQTFADSLTDKALRGSSTILDGDITSQLQYDPTGLDAAGNVVVAAATVDLFTCSDGTQVPLDQQAACAAAAAPADTTTPTPSVTPAAGANQAGTTTTTGANGMSNGMFIGLLIGGIALLLLGVGGLMYYQKSKDSNTVKPRV